MATVTPSGILRTLAKDLSKDFPRSPRETLGGYIKQNLPQHRPIYAIFDIFDLEEGRL